MSSEATFYTDEGVVITNKRAVFKSKTYAMRNITSVSLGRISASIGFPVLLCLGGVTTALAGAALMGDDGGTGVTLLGIGVGAVLLGGWLISQAKPTFIVQLSSSSGEIKALSSTDEDMIKSVIAAVNEAIIHGVD